MFPIKVSTQKFPSKVSGIYSFQQVHRNRHGWSASGRLLQLHKASTSRPFLYANLKTELAISVKVLTPPILLLKLLTQGSFRPPKKRECEGSSTLNLTSVPCQTSLESQKKEKKEQVSF